MYLYLNIRIKTFFILVLFIMNSDPFWKDDINILFDKHRLVEFVPTKDMNVNEKLNAATRFLIYIGILMSIVYKTTKYIYIPMIGGVLLYIIYEHYPHLVDQVGGGDNGENSFQMPTEHNPFMNVLNTDYVDNPQRDPAADIDLPEVKKQIDTQFSKGLFKNVDDIWNRNNSQRQYYTNPSTTIPNDRDSFMKWCYTSPTTCKEGNLTKCLNYETLKSHGNSY